MSTTWTSVRPLIWSPTTYLLLNWRHIGLEIGSVQGQVGWGFEQPVLLKNVPAQGDKWVALDDL